jgi:hypothetical protein
VLFSSPFSYSLFKRLWMALLVVIIDLLLASLEKLYNNSSNSTCYNLVGADVKILSTTMTNDLCES